MADMINSSLQSLWGNGISELMERKDITEIYVNDDGYIRYQSYKEGKVKTNIYLSSDKIQAIIEILAGQVGKVVNEDIPSISTEIRGYGARFQGEIPPIVRNPQ